MRPKIELLVGMIASGKSTFARHRADAGAVVVAHDDLTAMLHARYRYESGLREMYRAMEEALVIQAIWAGRDVVIDRTHLTRESRRRWISRAGTLNVPIHAVIFPIQAAETHAERRFHQDARGRTLGDWVGVARHHLDQATAEPLYRAEGFHSIQNGWEV